jgi:hypothetical protein
MRLLSLGGSGNYEWVSQNQSQVVASQDGFITSRDIAVRTYVEVRDKKNYLNYDRINVSVSYVNKYESLEQLKEVSVNN